MRNLIKTVKVNRHFRNFDSNTVGGQFATIDDKIYDTNPRYRNLYIPINKVWHSTKPSEVGKALYEYYIMFYTQCENQGVQVAASPSAGVGKFVGAEVDGSGTYTNDAAPHVKATMAIYWKDP